MLLDKPWDQMNQSAWALSRRKVKVTWYVKFKVKVKVAVKFMNVTDVVYFI